MNNDLISREDLKEVIKANHYLLSAKNNSTDYGMFTTGIIEAIDNAPTVIPEEFKPLIDKVVDILPELTSAVIEQLPQIISSNIKCSECSYYKDTWNVIPRPQGKWKETGYETGALGITYRQTQCSNCGWEHALSMWLNFCPNCGAIMDKKKEADNETN